MRLCPLSELTNLRCFSFMCVCPKRLEGTTKLGFVSTNYFNDLG